jgi:hypothetical protein
MLDPHDDQSTNMARGPMRARVGVVARSLRHRSLGHGAPQLAGPGRTVADDRVGPCKAGRASALPAPRPNCTRLAHVVRS